METSSGVEQAFPLQAGSEVMYVCFSSQQSDTIIQAGRYVSGQTQSQVRMSENPEQDTTYLWQTVETPTAILLTWQGVSIATCVFLLCVSV